MAEAFSKTMMARGGPLKCKECVQRQDAETRTNAAAVVSDETRSCASCQQELAAASYNKSQWSKGAGASRCKTCVDAAIATEAASVETARAAKMAAARQAVDDANKSGNALAVLKAESVLAALEGEQVTGLRPVKMNSRSARGGGGGGRGRAGSGRAAAGRGRR
jgi:hypothetical protein